MQPVITTRNVSPVLIRSSSLDTVHSIDRVSGGSFILTTQIDILQVRYKNGSNSSSSSSSSSTGGGVSGGSGGVGGGGNGGGSGGGIRCSGGSSNGGNDNAYQ